MSKSTTQKTTENSSQQSPAYVQDAAKYTLNAGQNMANPFLQMGNNAIAGFTPDQMAGMDWARDIAQQRNENSYKWYQGARDYVGDATYKAPDAASIQAQMNPFIQNVVDQNRKQAMGVYRDQDAGLGARYASANAFGGSGEALARGSLAKGTGEALANQQAQLMSQGFQQAQQAAMQNAAAAAASEDTRRARGMQGLSMGSELETQDLQRQLLGLQTLLGSGDAQQGQMQKSLDVPAQWLQLLAGMTPQDASMTSQSQKKTESSGGGNAISGLAGLASIAKSFGFICDRSRKTDIEEIGIDPDLGVPLYAFRYKEDPKSYPKSIGPMADEVEAKYPGSTRVVAGVRYIVRA